MPGGVCAVLDYDVELMADYVSEMATRVVMPRNTVNPAFRKYVSGILSSTRLPRTTILLGLNYLAKRINMMPAGAVQTEGEIWRLLTIALLLGSKFLDDNTFQNKSWSEVSGISVRDLNTLEYEWLAAIDWVLYVNLDESKDYNAWLDNWAEWKETKKRQQQQASRERLAALVTPIDTDVTRARNQHMYSSWHQQQVAEYERLSSMKRGQATPPAYRHEQASWGYMAWPQPAAPLTPPDSGYGTPEYTNSATSCNSHYTEWFDRAIVGGCNTSRHYQQPAPAYNGFRHSGHGSRNATNYSGVYDHGIWEQHRPGCFCDSCVSPHKQPPSYFFAHSYGQPVAG
ncbi:hypothetical protein QBC40DRAFT_76743 [Triangularia verruculosa]|uniref:Uncharacterized protein n=1 Tax=Triangularia verruculosa TaxID=2587418 RepID=A0AAN7ASY0_9PEZI|nr:hypothetical protein QBC40DRAFT_76743 [Triangularia verruculosa]